jgi:hypothetical protein
LIILKTTHKHIYNLLFKTILLSLVFLSNTSLKAEKVQINPILKCLAIEEQEIYKVALTGPIYYLNQELINLWTVAPEVKIKQKYISKICNNQNFSTSLALLKFIMVEKNDVFELKKEKTKSDITQENYIQELIDKSPEILVRYLGKVSMGFKKPICMEKNMKNYKKLKLNLTYLNKKISDKNFEYIVSKKEVSSIFTKLTNYNQIYKQCHSQKRTLATQD